MWVRGGGNGAWWLVCARHREFYTEGRCSLTGQIHGITATVAAFFSVHLRYVDLPDPERKAYRLGFCWIALA
ncbi:hypothetical protein EJ02DRAFT_252221 [Clathrospora elynae]|uniref:Uncharacterized protein n=1 Tax=Clathrospora elynae TaxID=706981 RepID=A0A6A5SJC4_9PLEO|nr:hypothetical protein EJ02DRAFT_252221 [Clathrospora elynae]